MISETIKPSILQWPTLARKSFSANRLFDVACLGHCFQGLEAEKWPKSKSSVSAITLKMPPALAQKKRQPTNVATHGLRLGMHDL